METTRHTARRVALEDEPRRVRAAFGIEGCEIELTAPVAVLRWIEALVEPFVRFRPGAAPRDPALPQLIAIGRDSRDRLANEQLDAGRPLRLHLERTGELRAAAGGFPKLVRSEKGDFWCRIDEPARLWLAGDLASVEFRRDIIRVMRALFEVRLIDRGFAKLHMGAVVVRGSAFAVCGPRNTGKTTLMCRMLELGPAAAFCSNDKSYVLASDSRPPLLLGSPQQIGLRGGTLAQYEGLPALSTYQNRGKTFFWMPALARYFGCGLEPAVRPSGVLVPEFRMDADRVETERLSEGEIRRLIREDVVDFTDDVSPRWLVDLLVGRREDRRATAEGLLALPWVRVRGSFRSRRVHDALAALATSRSGAAPRA